MGKNLCECEFCKNKLPFDLPIDLIEALKNCELVIFAGAGISTESSHVFKETLYEKIYNELSLNEEDGEFTFPQLMGKYEQETIDGRRKLIEHIRYRFEYCDKFKDLYYDATRFHSALAPLWQISDIITTNWDDYFEKECNAIPIVTEEDFQFYNVSKRKVFKIHGSISNYGSIVATSNDYEERLTSLESGVIGSYLKVLLSSKSIVFIGYSFSDYNFLKLLNSLKLQMKRYLPHIYIVSLDNDIGNKLEGYDYTLINTDGTYFLEILREHMEEEKLILKDDSIDRVTKAWDLLGDAKNLVINELLPEYKSPTVLYCMFYQDGMKHAFQNITYMMKGGEAYNPCRLMIEIKNYEKLLKQYEEASNYQEISYIMGYIEGFWVPLIDEIEVEHLQYFHIFGRHSTFSFEEFKDIVINKDIFHDEAEYLGRKQFSQYLESDNDIILRHKPFL